MALLHEMRHMGSPGYGMPDASDENAANAERFLNELQDYTRMFEHPYLLGLDPADVARLRGEFSGEHDVRLLREPVERAGPFEIPGATPTTPRRPWGRSGCPCRAWGGMVMPVLGIGMMGPGVSGMGGALRPVLHMLLPSKLVPAGLRARAVHHPRGAHPHGRAHHACCARPRSAARSRGGRARTSGCARRWCAAWRPRRSTVRNTLAPGARDAVPHDRVRAVRGRAVTTRRALTRRLGATRT